MTIQNVIARPALLIAGLLLSVSSPAYFVYHQRPDITQLLEQCKTPSVIHVGRTDLRKMYLDERTWDFRGHIPLEVLHRYFQTWQTAFVVDNNSHIIKTTYGSFSNALMNMAVDKNLCLLLDWQTKSYYLFKPDENNADNH